jgi:hypothetical protein
VIARGEAGIFPGRFPLGTTSGAVHLDAVAFSSPALAREAWWPAARSAGARCATTGSWSSYKLLARAWPADDEKRLVSNGHQR